MFQPAADVPQRPHSNTGLTASDSLSFRTALSDLASEAEEEDDDDAGTETPCLISPAATDLWRTSNSHTDTDADDDDGDLGSEAKKSLAVFRPSPLLPREAVISPQSHKSVPVAVQARRARHPVYRLGALANETFESGRHQEAFDLYSWALQLLNPALGTTAKEMLHAATLPRGDGRWSKPWNEALSPKYSNNTRCNSCESAREEKKEEEVVPLPPPPPPPPPPALPSPKQKSRSWLSFGRRSLGRAKAAAAAVVIDEPLPVAAVHAGQYEFSEAMLSQLAARRRRSSISDLCKEEEENDDDYDAWFMAPGDEKTDVCALLYSNRSAAAYALGKYAAAVSDATKSIELRPGWAKGHFRRGEALLAVGRIRDAYSAYRQASALEPHDTHVRVSCERARIMAQNEDMGLSVVQLLAGRDFALLSKKASSKWQHPIRAKIFDFAVGMQNYVYLIADARSRKCVVVDACWDTDAILATIERERLLLAGAIVTHSHFDHVGGVPPPPFASLRIRVAGLADLKRRFPHLPLLVHPLDIPEVIASNPQLRSQHFTPTPNGFAFRLGDRTDIAFMHTPGHTPGSQCVLVNQCRLFSGDTLFPGSCGRVDLKGGCMSDMLESLQARLAALSDQTIVYPGHEYAGEWTTIGREKKRGFLRTVGPQGSAEDRWRRLDPQRIVSTACCNHTTDV
ncbi:hypothetical protein GGI21_002487 [Coemansia aciculifera]|nr:hypothetical protein GGI21_002487 [Coemansia aciculifera]